MSDFLIPNIDDYISEPQKVSKPEDIVDIQQANKQGFVIPDINTALNPQPVAAAQPEEDRSEFGKGLERGVLSLKSLAHAGAAAIGGAFSQDFEEARVQDYMRLQKEMEALAPRIGRIEDINGTGDFFSWLAGVTGEQVPMLVGFAVSGGLPGLITKKVGEKVLTKTMGEAAKKMAAKYAGRMSLAGATTYGATVGTGEVYGEQIEGGLDRNRALAIGAGSIIGALDTLSFTKIAGALGFGEAAKGTFMQSLRSLPVAKRTLAMGALVGGSEAGTEALQEVVAIAARKLVDDNYDTMGPEAKSRVLNSAAAGFFVGGIPGSVGGAFSKAPEGGRDRGLPENGSPKIEEPSEAEVVAAEQPTEQPSEPPTEPPVAATPVETPAAPIEPIATRGGEGTAAEAPVTGPREPLPRKEGETYGEYIKRLHEWEQRGGFTAEQAGDLPAPPTDPVEQTQYLELLDQQLRQMAELGHPTDNQISKQLRKHRKGNKTAAANIENSDPFPTAYFPEMLNVQVYSDPKSRSLKEVYDTQKVIPVGFNGMYQQKSRAVGGQQYVTYNTALEDLKTELALVKENNGSATEIADIEERMQNVMHNKVQHRKLAAATIRSIKAWQQTFMPNTRIIVSDGSYSNHLAETGRISELAKGGLKMPDYTAGHIFELDDGTMVIETNATAMLRNEKLEENFIPSRIEPKEREYSWMDSKLNIDLGKLYGNLAHEFGHILTIKAWREAPEYVRQAVFSEYRRFLSDMDNLTVPQFMQRYGKLPTIARINDRGAGRVHAKGRDLTVTEMIENDPAHIGYIMSFKEYLAEQTARYAHRSPRMQQPVQRFFGKLFATLKRFFNKVKGTFKPNTAFQTWLEWLAVRRELNVPFDTWLSKHPHTLEGGSVTVDVETAQTENVVEETRRNMEQRILNFLQNSPVLPKVVNAELAPFATRNVTRIGVLENNHPGLQRLPVSISENPENIGKRASEVNLSPGEVAVVGFNEREGFAQELYNVMKKWVTDFSPDMKVVVTDRAPWRDNTTTSYGSFARDQRGVHYIYLNQSAIELLAQPHAKEYMFETLAHEFGHSIIAQEFRRTSQNERKIIYNAYKRWLKDLTGDMTVREFFKKWSPYVHFLNKTKKSPESMLNMKLKDWLQKLDNPEYFLSFDEFAAQQIARYMSEGPKNVPASSFWGRIKETMRKLYDGARYMFRPHIEFRIFMDGLAQNAKDRQMNNLVSSAAGLQVNEIDYDTFLPKPIKDIQKGLSSIIRDTESLSMAQPNNIAPAKFNWFTRLSLTLTQMAEQNLHIPGVKQYLETVRNWWAEKTRWTDRAQLTLEAWENAGFNKNEAEAFNKLLLEATQISDKEGRALNEEEKIALFEKYGLNREEAQALYETIQLDFRQGLDALFEVLERDAQIRFAQNATALREALKKLQKEKAVLQNRDFFPLTRFGQFWTLVRASSPIKINGKLYKAGETIEFKMYERESDMKKEFNRLQKNYGSRMLVSGGVMSNTVSAFQGMPRSMIENLREKLDLTPEQQEELDLLLHELAPGQSYKKHLLHRKGTGGFSEDAKRGYANYFMHFANHLSRIKHYHEMTNAFKELDDHIRRLRKTPGGMGVKEQQLRDWMDRHYEYSMNPGNEWANLRSMGFLWYLGFLPKSALVNFTQVPLVTYPYLSSRYGDVKTVKALTKAMTDIRKLWARGKGLETDLQTAIEKGIEAGFLDESLATELAAVAEGSNLQALLPGTFLRSEKGARMVRKAASYGAWMFQKAEKVNRLQTFAAAFRLAREGGLTEAQAFEAARDAVEKTQFEYARWNRPEFMRGKKSVIFLFWQYMQNTLYFAATDKGRARFLFMMLMMAGLSGLPFADDFMDMLDWTMTKLKGQLGWKNPKTDVRLAIREMASDLGLHPDWVMHGLARRTFGMAHIGEMMGIPIPEVDLSGSLSLGRIVPGVEPIFGREGKLADRFTATATDVGGAAFSIPMSILQALSDDNPDVFKRWERALPSSLKSISRAYRFATEGMETTRTGAKLIDFNVNDPEQLSEIIAQGLGAAPTRLNVERQLRWLQKEHAQYYQVRRGMLMEQFAYALKTRDREAVAQMRKRIRAYNEYVPHPSLRIGRADLARSLKARRRGQALSERGYPVSRREAPLFESLRSSFK